MTTASKNSKSKLYVILKAKLPALASSVEVCGVDSGPGSQLVEMSTALLEVKGTALVFSSKGSGQTTAPSPLPACMCLAQDNSAFCKSVI